MSTPLGCCWCHCVWNLYVQANNLSGLVRTRHSGMRPIKIPTPTFAGVCVPLGGGPGRNRRLWWEHLVYSLVKGCDVIKQQPCINLELSHSLWEMLGAFSCAYEHFFSSSNHHQVQPSPHDDIHSYCAFTNWGILYSLKSERQLVQLPLFNP